MIPLPPPVRLSAFRRIEQDYSDDKLKKGLARLTQKSTDEVHAAVGRGELPVSDVIRAIVPDVELAKQATVSRKPNRRPWIQFLHERRRRFT